MTLEAIIDAGLPIVEAIFDAIKQSRAGTPVTADAINAAIAKWQAALAADNAAADAALAAKFPGQ